MSKNATKETLIEKMHFKTGISKEEARDIIEIFIDQIKNSLLAKEQLKIHMFGTFQVKNKKSRIGRNPKTMEESIISARKVISFVCSRTLKKELLKKID